MNVPISKELCAKLDLPIERWGTIRKAVEHYCSGYAALLRKAALDDAQDEDDFLALCKSRLEFEEFCGTDLPSEVMSIARDVQQIRSLTDAQAVTLVVEVVRAFIRTNHALDTTADH